MQRIVETGLIGLLLFAPLPFGGNSSWAIFILQFAALSIFILWLLQLNKKPYIPTLAGQENNKPLLKAWLLLPFALLALIMVFQLLPLPVTLIDHLFPARAELTELESFLPNWATISIYPLDTLKSLIFYISCLAVFIVTYGYVSTRYAVRRIGWVIVLSGAFQAIYGSIEYLSGHQYIFSYEKIHYLESATGTFINRNHFASYLLLCIGVGWGMFRYFIGKSGRQSTLLPGRAPKAALTFFLITLMLVGIILSGSRGAFVVLISVFLIFQVFLPILKRRWQWPILVAALSVCALLLVLWIGKAPLAGRMGEFALDLPTANHRSDAWKASIRMLVDAPLTGWGAGTYKWRYPAYQPVSNKIPFHHAHNDYLELAAETGLPGIFFFLLGLGLILGFTIKRFNQRTDRFSRCLTIGGWLAVFAILFHSLVDFPLQIPGIAVTFSAVLGLTCSAVTRRLR